ncbi:expansin [Trebouxia sp. C0009 RCD-2024]
MQIAPMLNGRIDIKYRRVECTPPVPVKVQIDGNSGPGGWLRLSVTTNGGSGGVRSVQVKGPNSGWTGLTNLYGAAWEIAQQPQLPIDLHVTADSGQEITAFGVITKSGQTGTVSTGQQFNFNGPPSYDEASSIGESSSSASASSSSGSSDSDSSSGSGSSPSSALSSGSGGSSSSSSSGSDSSSSSSSGSSSSGSGTNPDSIQSSIAKGGPSSSASSSGGGSQVSAYEGPSTSSPSPSSSSGKTCNDKSPDTHSCAQQKKWGKCGKSWLSIPGSDTPYGYCAKTCGRC